MDLMNFQAAAIATPPAAETSPSAGYPTDGDPSGGVPATVPGAAWFYQVLAEMHAVLTAAGITPDDTDLTQLLTAIQTLDTASKKVQAVARAANTILAAGDLGKLIVATGTWTQTLTAAATLGDGWWVMYRNDGTGVITLDPNAGETVDGTTTVALDPGQSRLIVCDGANFKTVGRNTSTSGSFTITGTGFSGTAPSATATYRIVDGYVYLNIPTAAIVGTSNTTAFTLTGLPAAIRPSSGAFCPALVCQDNSSPTWASASVSVGGVITLGKAGSTSGWTASGNKALYTSDLIYKL